MKHHLITLGFVILIITLIVLLFKYTLFFTIGILIAAALATLYVFIHDWVKEAWEK